MDKEKIQKDLEYAKQYKQEINEKIKKWIDEYEGKPYGNEIDGRSKIVWKLIKKHGEILVANLAKPLLYGTNLISLDPRTKYDEVKSRIDEKLINYFFNKEFDKTTFIKNMIRVPTKEGTCIIKVSWERTNRVNRPYAEVLFNEDVFTDPDAQTIEDCKFIIHRYKTTYEDLEKNPIYSQEAIERFKAIQNSKTSFDDIDVMSEDLHNRTTLGSLNKEDDGLFLYEYWYKKGDKIYVTSFLNDDTETIILSDEEFEYEWYPFVSIPFYEEEYKIWGRGLADIISDEQKFMTSVVRGVIDNMALSNNGTKFVKKGALDAINFKNLMEGKPVVEVNASDDVSRVIRDGSFNELPAMVYNLLQIIENQAEGLTGVSKMMQGLQDIRDAKATTAQLVMTQSQIRLLDLENNIANGLTKLVRMWLEMIMDYITEEQMFQITGTTFAEEKAKLTEQLKKEYKVDEMPPDVQQKAMMLIIAEVERIFDKKTVKYDINITIGTDGLKQAKINQINMLMQQSSALVQAGIVPQEIMRQLMAKLFELFDFYDLAEKIKTYEPKPDPLQQQMMQIQLQAELAKAKKDEALAQNALARTEMTAIKAQKEYAKLDPELAKEYAEVLEKIKKIQKELGGEDVNNI